MSHNTNKVTYKNRNNSELTKISRHPNNENVFVIFVFSFIKITKIDVILHNLESLFWCIMEKKHNCSKKRREILYQSGIFYIIFHDSMIAYAHRFGNEL